MFYLTNAYTLFLKSHNPNCNVTISRRNNGIISSSIDRHFVHIMFTKAIDFNCCTCKQLSLGCTGYSLILKKYILFNFQFGLEKKSFRRNIFVLYLVQPCFLIADGTVVFFAHRFRLFSALYRKYFFDSRTAFGVVDCFECLLPQGK